jgi:TRAP-type C4-dicarboxylate transport system permease small subunit
LNLDRVRGAFEWLLETIVVVLVVVLTVLVICGFCFRYVGYALSWYDELASVGLVWLTYYGSALAALRGAHIGVPGFVNAMPPRWRVTTTIFAEVVFFIFFIMLSWTGVEVLAALGGEYLVSLDWVPQRLTASAIPIGAALVVVAEALRLPKLLRDARGSGFIDTEAIEAMAHGAPELDANAGHQETKR